MRGAYVNRHHHLCMRHFQMVPKKKLARFLVALVVFLLVVHFWLQSSSSSPSTPQTDDLFDPYELSDEERSKKPIGRLEELQTRFAQLKSEFDAIFKRPECEASRPTFDPSCKDRIVAVQRQLAEHTRISGLASNCSASPCRHHRKTYFHTFWHVPDGSSVHNEFNKRALRLNIMSFLATQNLCCAQLVVWQSGFFSKRLERSLRRSFAIYVARGQLAFRPFRMRTFCAHRPHNGDNDEDPVKHAFYSAFRQHAICRASWLNLDALVFYELRMYLGIVIAGLSDLIRFVILDFYGGIYVDGDVLFLHDFSLLYNENFAYRWSFTHYWNTAVMGLNKYIEPRHVTRLLDHVLAQTDWVLPLSMLFHPEALSSQIGQLDQHRRNTTIYNYEGMRTMHSYVFDAAWLCHDKREERLSAASVCRFGEFGGKEFGVREEDFEPAKFFPGALAFHYHLGHNQARVHNGSYFALFERYFKRRLELDVEDTFVGA